MTRPNKPYYPLRDVKNLLRCNHFEFTDDALESGHNDFEWGGSEMTQALLRLNDRLHKLDPEKNHYYKTKPHRFYPNTMMDYYKIRNGHEGNRIYTHLCVYAGGSGKLIISSFKELQI